MPVSSFDAGIYELVAEIKIKNVDLYETPPFIVEILLPSTLENEFLETKISRITRIGLVYLDFPEDIILSN